MTTFSIITPSFRGAEWLPLCLASVADQEGVQVEHIVQDSCSTDGTEAILKAHPEVQAFIEKDAGMYDAINRGLARAKGDILAYLNVDEQYLPGTLQKVAAYFESHPRVDFLAAGLVIVDATGAYICSRKVLPPLAPHTRVCHLSTFSCSLFFRRRVVEEHRIFFDPAWKAVGDAEWILRALDAGMVMRSIPDLTSVFTDTGDNLGGTEQSSQERERLKNTAPAWQKLAVPLIAAHHRLRRLLGGIYQQTPFDYDIYTKATTTIRTRFHVEKPVTIWKSRFTMMR